MGDTSNCISDLRASLGGDMFLVHYMAKGASDPDYEGLPALCDVKAGKTEMDRDFTVTSTIKSEIDCPDCLQHMGEE